MEKYSYRLKDSARKDMMIINGIRLEKGKDYYSPDKLNFGQFDGIVIRRLTEGFEEYNIKTKQTIQKKKEKEVIKKIDLTKVSKKSLIEYIQQNTNDAILNDKNLMDSLKKSDLIDIINMMEE